jgi:hypothetical protein
MMAYSVAASTAAGILGHAHNRCSSAAIRELMRKSHRYLLSHEPLPDTARKMTHLKKVSDKNL